MQSFDSICGVWKLAREKCLLEQLAVVLRVSFKGILEKAKAAVRRVTELL